MSESLRLVKKYPNRRLYDTKTSAYVTLADIKGFVLGHERFKVVDAKSGDDLTRSILLQIVIDEEGAAVPLFSAELLAQLIRLYGHATEGLLASCLEANIKAFGDFHQKFAEQSMAFCAERSRQRSELWSQCVSINAAAMPGGVSADPDQHKNAGHPAPEPVNSQALEALSAQTPAVLVASSAGRPGNRPK